MSGEDILSKNTSQHLAYDVNKAQHLDQTAEAAALPPTAEKFAVRQDLKRTVPERPTYAALQGSFMNGTVTLRVKYKDCRLPGWSVTCIHEHGERCQNERYSLACPVS